MSAMPSSCDFVISAGRTAWIYYVVFSWDLYRKDLLSIFNLRRGGLAIYGAVIAAFITLFVYAKIKKLSPYIIYSHCIRHIFLPH